MHGSAPRTAITLTGSSTRTAAREVEIRIGASRTPVASEMRQLPPHVARADQPKPAGSVDFLHSQTRLALQQAMGVCPAFAPPHKGKLDAAVTSSSQAARTRRWKRSEVTRSRLHPITRACGSKDRGLLRALFRQTQHQFFHHHAIIRPRIAQRLIRRIYFLNGRAQPFARERRHRLPHLLRTVAPHADSVLGAVG